jgi:hypothetical protein
VHLDHRFFDRQDLAITTALCLPLPLWRPRQPNTEAVSILLRCSHRPLELAGDHGCFCFLARHGLQHLDVFNVGQIVQFQPDRNERFTAPAEAYEITKRLPHNRQEYECRIKSAHEEHERIARESQATSA